MRVTTRRAVDVAMGVCACSVLVGLSALAAVRTHADEPEPTAQPAESEARQVAQELERAFYGRPFRVELRLEYQSGEVESLQLIRNDRMTGLAVTGSSGLSEGGVSTPDRCASWRAGHDGEYSVAERVSISVMRAGWESLASCAGQLSDVIGVDLALDGAWHDALVVQLSPSQGEDVREWMRPVLKLVATMSPRCPSYILDLYRTETLIKKRTEESVEYVIPGVVKGRISMVSGLPLQLEWDEAGVPARGLRRVVVGSGAWSDEQWNVVVQRCGGEPVGRSLHAQYADGRVQLLARAVLAVGERLSGTSVGVRAYVAERLLEAAVLGRWAHELHDADVRQFEGLFFAKRAELEKQGVGGSDVSLALVEFKLETLAAAEEQVRAALLGDVERVRGIVWRESGQRPGMASETRELVDWLAEAAGDVTSRLRAAHWPRHR